MRRQAFTLVEILVAISVVAILAGMVIAVIPMVSRSVKRSRAESLLATVGNALELAVADRSVTPGVVPHPLAGSKAPRRPFVRGAAFGAIASGATVATSGEALLGPAPDQVVVNAAPRLLHGSDRCADSDAPHLFGMRRDRLTVLGASWAAVVDYRRLPSPRSLQNASGATSWQKSRTDADGDGIVDNDPNASAGAEYAPDANVSTADLYPDVTCRIRGDATLADQLSALRIALGSATLDADLAGLGALSSPADDTALICNDRLWGKAATSYAPGRIRDSGTWYDYRLRGPSIVDPWGTEILISPAASGKGWRLESAGPDRSFRWKIDSQGNLPTTDATAEPTAAQDARRDNILLGLLPDDP